MLRSLLGDGLVVSEGDRWLRQRRLMQPAFHRQGIAAYGEVMATYASRRAAGWHDCPGDFEAAFQSAADARAAAVLLQDDPLLRTVGVHIAGLALKHRLPVSTGVAELADAGVLMAYGPDRVDPYRRAAGLCFGGLRARA